MTQEEKQLLLIDLCARLPYETMFYSDRYGEDCLLSIDLEFNKVNEVYSLEEIEPFLRPLESMTEEEKWEYIDIKKGECDGCVLTGKGDPNTEFMLVDFYNKHHLDYRGLIPMGLALEAPEGMYKTE